MLTSYERINLILIKARSCEVEEQTIRNAKNILRKNPSIFLLQAYQEGFEQALKEKNI